MRVVREKNMKLNLKSAARTVLPFASLLLGGSALPLLAEPLSPEFASLFDGRAMSGFTSVGAAKWSVASGDIVAGPGGGWLQMKAPWQDGRIKFRFRCDNGCDTGILIRGRAAAGGFEGVYMSLAPADAGMVSAAVVDANGKILSTRNPERIAVPPRPSTFAGMSTEQTPGAPPPSAAPAGGRGGGNPAAPVAMKLNANDWNYVTFAIRDGAVSAEINGKVVNTGQPMAGISDFGFAGIKAAPGLRVKDLAFEDFIVRTEPTGKVGAGFAMQRLSELYYGESATIADVNKDGKMDIIAGPVWFEGPDFKKSHEFAVPVSGNIGFGYTEFAGTELADWNGDGWPDILEQEIDKGFPVYLYINPRGENRHWERHLVVPYTRSETHMTCDLFKDGRRELVASINGKLGWLFPADKDVTKLWTFHTISDTNVGGPRDAPTQHGLGCGDVNGDGRVDVVDANGWWEQPAKVTDAAWTFHSAPFDIYTDKEDGGGGADMIVYDVNGDGRADIVSSLRGHGYGLAWYEQTANGGWIRHMIMNSPDKAGPEDTIAPFSELHVLRMADMDGDGLKDIIAGKRWWSHGDLYREEGFQAPAVLYWFKLSRAGGKVTFTPHLIHDNSGIGTYFAVGDVNGDGRPDIVTDARHGAFLFLNTMGKKGK